MKSELRRLYVKLRQGQSVEQAAKHSSIITNKLLELKNIHDAHCVMAYFAFRGEVDLQPFFDICRDQSKCICLPRITRDGVIEAAEYTEGCNLLKNKYGILEPSGTRYIQKKDIDAIIAPAVAFDDDRFRLGYGGGYYDRFLEGTDAIKIGVGFDFQIVGKLPTEKHDIQMDMVVSEKRTLGET